MGWLRHTIVDLAVTAAILVSVFAGQGWLMWVVRVYTPLMVVLKGTALLGRVTPSTDGVPDWFYHLLYAVNVMALLYAQQYWLVGGWVAIWLFSVIAGARSKPAKAKAKAASK